ncbi:MAG: hypothetical protein QOJ64_2139 [Acidobacteriota bacterium]|jgi:hypothetical protein|nr:hypothetical protein [Acidobacteriota bacterium]
MALAQKGIGEAAVRHCDPTSLTHKRHSRAASNRRVVERVIVDVTRDDAVRLNSLCDEWEKKWDGWDGSTFLVEKNTYLLPGARRIRTNLVECDGRTFTSAATRINRLDWYWSVRSDKGVERRVKRKVEKKRVGRLCDRHTVTLSPPAMRLFQKLNLSERDAKRLLSTLQTNSLQFFAEETGRHLVGSAAHADSGILHFDIVSSRIDPDHKLCGEKSIPAVSNEGWTIGAWRQKQLGCRLTETKSKWLDHNLRRFAERHGEKQPLLLKLHAKLDDDFEHWVTNHGHSKLWEQSKQEYRDWVAETDQTKEKWAQERASGKNATKLAERAAMYALRMVLPPTVYNAVRTSMTAAQVVNDLLAGDANPNITGLLLQLTIRGGLKRLNSKKSRYRNGSDFTPTTPKL